MDASLPLRYSATELLRLRLRCHLPGPAPEALHLHPDITFQPRGKYIHRGSRRISSTRRNFVYHQQPEQCIPSIWTPVAQLVRGTFRALPPRGNFILSRIENVEWITAYSGPYRDTPLPPP
ncbi:unnamed protein product [Gadus morhua 'NCC']